MAKQIQEVTGRNVQIVFVDQGYAGEDAAIQAEQEEIRLGVIQACRSQKRFRLIATALGC